jgi:hypothetical protein
MRIVRYSLPLRALRFADSFDISLQGNAAGLTAAI